MHIPNSGGGAILFSSHRVKKIAAGIKIQLLIVIHYLKEEREKEMSSAKRNRELSRKLKDSVSLIQEELQLDPNGKFIKISCYINSLAKLFCSYSCGSMFTNWKAT